ncbi:hypothetical protein FRC19_007097, partial [Serendipita sp. 401]
VYSMVQYLFTLRRRINTNLRDRSRWNLSTAAAGIWLWRLTANKKRRVVVVQNDPEEYALFFNSDAVHFGLHERDDNERDDNDHDVNKRDDNDREDKEHDDKEHDEKERDDNKRNDNDRDDNDRDVNKPDDNDRDDNKRGDDDRDDNERNDNERDENDHEHAGGITSPEK